MAVTWARRPSGLLVPSLSASSGQRRDRPVAVDFFAGAGGFSLGFHTAGWDVAAAVEYDLTAAATYLCNLGNPGTIVHFDDPARTPSWEKYEGSERRRWVKCGAAGGFGGAGTGWISNSCCDGCRIGGHEERNNSCLSCGWAPGECGCARCCDARPVEHFWIADVRNLTGTEILDALGMRRGEVDAVIGGPPCQGFSAIGKRNTYDARNSLVFEFARMIIEISPKTFVMENVVGMLSMVTPEGIPVIDAFCRVIADGGFSTYDALKRTLNQQAGAFGGVRDDNARSKTRNPAPAQTPDDQLDLFDQGDTTR